MGTATGVTLGPFIAIGAGIGLVGWSILARKTNRDNTTTQKAAH
jgi:hypothetical protein